MWARSRERHFGSQKEDLAEAQKSKEYFQKEWYPNDKIATTIEPLEVLYDAEDYHQK